MSEPQGIQIRHVYDAIGTRTCVYTLGEPDARLPDGRPVYYVDDAALTATPMLAAELFRECGLLPVSRVGFSARWQFSPAWADLQHDLAVVLKTGLKPDDLLILKSRWAEDVTVHESVRTYLRLKVPGWDGALFFTTPDVDLYTMDEAAQRRLYAHLHRKFGGTP